MDLTRTEPGFTAAWTAASPGLIAQVELMKIMRACQKENSAVKQGLI